MSDQANIVGKVTADTSSAVASMNALRRSADATGLGFSGFAAKASSAIDTAAVGLSKFNLAMGGIQKAIQLMSGAVGLVKFSAEMKQTERRMAEMGVSVDTMSRAVDGAVKRSDLMGFALRQMQGEMALTKDQMILVLQAADALGDQGFGDTMKIAEDLAGVLAGKSTRALRDYKIDVENLGEGQAKTNALLAKYKQIVESGIKVDKAVDDLDRLSASMGDFWDGAKRDAGEAIGFFASAAVKIGQALDAEARWEDRMARRIAKGLGEGYHDQATAVDDAISVPGVYERGQAWKAEAERKRLSSFSVGDTYSSAASASSKWANDFAANLGYEFSKATKKMQARAAAASSKGSQRLSMTGGMDPDMFLDGLSGAGAYDFTNIGGLSMGRDSGDLSDLMGGDSAMSNDDFIAQMQAQVQAKKDAAAKEAARMQAYNEQLALQTAQLDIYAQAAGLAANAMFSLGEAMLTGTGNASAFLKELSRGVMGMGKDAAFKALYFLAEGWAFPLRRAESFTAAKFYATAAAVAIPTAAAIGALSGGGGGASPSSPSAGGFAGPSITSNPEAGGGVTIQVNGNLYGDPNAFGRAVVDGMDAAARSGRTRIRPSRFH